MSLLPLLKYSNPQRHLQSLPSLSKLEVCGIPEWEAPNFNSSNQQWVEFFGLTDSAMLEAGRILFVRDGGESTSAIGPPLEFEGLRGRNETRTIQVWGLGHTGDMWDVNVELWGNNSSLDYVSLLSPYLCRIKGWTDIIG